MIEFGVLETPPTAEQADGHYEVIDGRRVELPPMGAYETGLAGIIAQWLGVFLRNHDLGRVIQEMLFDLAKVNRERRPDVAFVSYDRWPRGRRIPRANSWPVVPDLAVEVVSPSNLAEDVLAKMHEYFTCGVRLVWIVWPAAEQVYVYMSPTDVAILGRTDVLDGGAVLQGFRLPLTELFEEETDPAPQSAPPAASSDQ